MINPVSNSHQSHTHPTTQVKPPGPPERKPPSTQVQDKVTIHRPGDVDHDGDRH